VVRFSSLVGVAGAYLLEMYVDQLTHHQYTTQPFTSWRRKALLNGFQEYQLERVYPAQTKSL
jgi:hypothetical protein